MSESQAIEDLLSERAIRAKVSLYCQGVDRKQYELVRACFHDDAIDSHGAFNGSPDGFIEFVTERHQHIGSSMHFLGTSSIVLSDDRRRARSETYCIAYQHILPGADDPFAGDSAGGAYLTMGCRYVDTFERRADGEWKIWRRTVVYEWIRKDDSSHYEELPPALEAFKRDQTDLVFAPLDDPNPSRS